LSTTKSAHEVRRQVLGGDAGGEVPARDRAPPRPATLIVPQRIGERLGHLLLRRRRELGEVHTGRVGIGHGGVLAAKFCKCSSRPRVRSRDESGPSGCLGAKRLPARWCVVVHAGITRFRRRVRFMFSSMGTGAMAPEDLAAARAFVEHTLAEHPDRVLPAWVLVETLHDVERVEGAVLDGAAVELACRLAGLQGCPPPGFPDEFHADFSAVGDRELAVCVLGLAQRLEAGAAPAPSRGARFLVLGVARLLAADPLVLPPLHRGSRTAERTGTAGGPSHPAGMG
jgi:hypothetical protein